LIQQGINLPLAQLKNLSLTKTVGKKGKLYLLILVNLLAWGFVGYKVYCALQGDDNIDLAHEKTDIKKIKEAEKEDSILLSLNYPDPFLKGGNFSREKKTNYSSYNIKTEKLTTQSKPKPLNVIAPVLDIKYIGLVKNNEKGTQTAMINMNGKSFFVKLNDVIEGYTFYEVSKDFIKIKKGKELIMISK
jgi:hypothetical protein